MEHSTSFYFLVPLLQLSEAVYQTMIWALRFSGSKKDQLDSFVLSLKQDYGFKFLFDRAGQHHAVKKTQDMFIRIDFFDAKNRLEIFLKRKNEDPWTNLTWEVLSPGQADEWEQFDNCTVDFINHPLSREQFMTLFYNFYQPMSADPTLRDGSNLPNNASELRKSC